MEVDEYREQLREIDQALVDDPENEELKEVRTELLELIEMLSAKPETGTDDPPVSASKQDQTPTESEGDPVGETETESKAEPNDSKESKDPKTKSETEPEPETEPETEPLAKTEPEPNEPKEPKEPKLSTYPVGTPVLALKDGSYAPAKVIAISGAGQLYTVKFDKSTHTLPAASLRPRPPKAPPKPKPAKDLLEHSKEKWQSFQKKRPLGKPSSKPKKKANVLGS